MHRYFAATLTALLVCGVAWGAGKKETCAVLTFDAGELTGRILHLPEEGELESSVDTRMIVEYYSR